MTLNRRAMVTGAGRMIVAGCALLCLLQAGSAQATTRRVPAQYATIQAGIDAAQPGDIVQVAAGFYSDVTHHPAWDTTKCIAVMKSGITLRGAGTDSTFREAWFRGRGIYCSGVTNATIEGLTVRY